MKDEARKMNETDEAKSRLEACATKKSEAESSRSAVAYWGGNLDPQNLEREGGEGPGIPLEDEIEFAATPDFEAAREWLAGGAGGGGTVIDLGAGLGAASFAFARRGARVICVDASPARLAELRRRAAEAGVSDRILAVAAAAEALPFRSESAGAIYTKSVLIHTDLPRAAAEIARALAPGGRAALVEPQPGNPFAWLYRRTLAPAAWKGITRYFGREEQEIFLRAIGGGGDGRDGRGEGSVAPFYLFSFLAFFFQFGWPRLGLFKGALGVISAIDQALFALVPPLRRLAWFGSILAEKRRR